MVDIVVRRCAGLDVHKDQVTSCVLVINEHGELKREVRTHETNTRGLNALKKWLLEEQVTHAAMESTGVYWKPVFNVLEGHVPTLLVVNAQHIKNVPGRKTDVNDCEWIAQLLQHGLLRGSFIPPENVREWRDVTRMRTRLEQERTRHANRLQKTLEDANIKLASVASDVLGVSGREMIRAMIAGETDPFALADLAKRRLRQHLPELRAALDGRVTEHHRFMLEFVLDEVEQTERSIAKLDERLGSLMAPFAEDLTRLQTIPGVAVRTAQILLAEIGPDMRQFPTPQHLASWAGLCPGNNMSAGKRKGRANKKGSRWLRGALNEAAHAASRCKNSYLKAQHRRIKARRGPLKATMAVAHSIIIAVHHMLSKKVDYLDLGVDYFDKIRKDRLVKHYVRRLIELGVPAAQVAALSTTVTPRRPRVDDEVPPPPTPRPRRPQRSTQRTLFAKAR